MATSTENLQNIAEAAVLDAVENGDMPAELTDEQKEELFFEAHKTLTLEFTEAQVKALNMLGKIDSKVDMLQGAIDARIKGAFKLYADKAEMHFGNLYDEACKHKFMPNIGSKDEFIKSYMSEVLAVKKEL